MKFCFGTVCWDGYLEKYINLFVDNYIMLFRKLINSNVDYCDIANPQIIYTNDLINTKTTQMTEKLYNTTGKKLILIHDKHNYTDSNIMYSTRNRLRSEFRKTYPTEQKVFFYFPIDDRLRSDVILELLRLAKMTKPSACMLKFKGIQPNYSFTAATQPICSYKDIDPSNWGGYCIYNILDEDSCPLYPKIDIPNVAFYIELYKAGYKEYYSSEICVDHLRHFDSHHFKHKDTETHDIVEQYLLQKKEELRKLEEGEQ